MKLPLMTGRNEHGHKQLVAQHFSNSVAYWRRIYEDDQNDIDSLYRTNIADRKECVLSYVDRFAAGRSLRVLDVGCGAGVIMAEVVRRGHAVVGMDLSEEMLQEAKRCTEATAPKRSVLVRGDIEQLPFPSNSFDIVLCIGVLSYVPNDNKSIEEISRVTRMQGHVIIALPNKLRMNVLFDPSYYWGWVKKCLSAKLITLLKIAQSQTNISMSLHDVMRGMRRYYVRQLSNIYAACKLKELAIEGVGYGPITFCKRECMPTSTSLKFSKNLERLSHFKLLSILNVFANHMVICLQKER